MLACVLAFGLERGFPKELKWNAIMSPAVLKGTESSDPHFALWWVLCLLASWLLAKEPTYYGGKLHALINYRIFLQGIRQKGQESGLVSWGWTLIGYATLGLIMVGSTNFHVTWMPKIPEGFGQVPIWVLMWTIALVIAFMVWAGWLRLWAWVAEFAEGFLWLKASFNLVFHVLIPVLLWISLIYRFGTNRWVTVAYATSGVLLALTIGFRWVRLLRLAKEFSMNRLFLMIFYICTFEIIPILMIAMN